MAPGLHLNLGHVQVRAYREGYRQPQPPVVGALAGHVEHVLHAVDRVLERRHFAQRKRVRHGPKIDDVAEIEAGDLRAQGAAARMSEGLDFSAPDRIDDAVFNRILWAMLKPAGTVPPVTNMAPVHALQLAR